jgi:hypothetical protein
MLLVLLLGGQRLGAPGIAILDSIISSPKGQRASHYDEGNREIAH